MQKSYFIQLSKYRAASRWGLRGSISKGNEWPWGAEVGNRGTWQAVFVGLLWFVGYGLLVCWFCWFVWFVMVCLLVCWLCSSFSRFKKRSIGLFTWISRRVNAQVCLVYAELFVPPKGSSKAFLLDPDGDDLLRMSAWWLFVVLIPLFWCGFWHCF